MLFARGHGEEASAQKAVHPSSCPLPHVYHPAMVELSTMGLGEFLDKGKTFRFHRFPENRSGKTPDRIAGVVEEFRIWPLNENFMFGLR